MHLTSSDDESYLCGHNDGKSQYMVSLAICLGTGVHQLRNQKCGVPTALSLVSKRCALATGPVNSEASILVNLGRNIVIDKAALVAVNDPYLMVTFRPSKSTVASTEAGRTEWDRVVE